MSHLSAGRRGGCVAANRASLQLELGVHEQWCEAANVPGQYWSGFHIIDIGPEDYNVLYDWVMSPGGQLV